MVGQTLYRNLCTTWTFMAIKTWLIVLFIVRNMWGYHKGNQEHQII